MMLDRRARRPLHRQLYEGYRQAILDRCLRAGQRVPATRALAEELGISRITVLTAFEQLIAEGFLEGRPGAGTFVAAAVAEIATRPAVDTGRVAGTPRRSARVARFPLHPKAEPWLGGSGAFRVSQPAVAEQ